MGSTLVLAGDSSRVVSATLSLSHVGAPTVSFRLEVRTDGRLARFVLTGVIRAPALPGPSVLDVTFIEDPVRVPRHGREGLLLSSDAPSTIQLRQVGGDRVRIRGHALLLWSPLRGEATSEERAYEIALDLDACVECARQHRDIG
jgi:hypothetical protein